jgi:Domain of unknown function (DUF1648)
VTSRAAVIALAAYTFISIRSALPQLPERIPTKFDWHGDATGWGGPNTLWMLLAFQVLGSLVMLAIPAIGRRAPQLVNLGFHRLSDYSAAARERIMPLLTDMSGYLAILYSFLFAFLTREIIRAALVPGTHPRMWPVGAFVAGTVGLTIYYVRRFAQEAKSDSLSGSRQ